MRPSHIQFAKRFWHRDLSPWKQAHTVSSSVPTPAHLGIRGWWHAAGNCGRGERPDGRRCAAHAGLAQRHPGDDLPPARHRPRANDPRPCRPPAPDPRRRHRPRRADRRVSVSWWENEPPRHKGTKKRQRETGSSRAVIWISSPEFPSGCLGTAPFTCLSLVPLCLGVSKQTPGDSPCAVLHLDRLTDPGYFPVLTMRPVWPHSIPLRNCLPSKTLSDCFGRVARWCFHRLPFPIPLPTCGFSP